MTASAHTPASVFVVFVACLPVGNDVNSDSILVEVDISAEEAIRKSVFLWLKLKPVVV